MLKEISAGKEVFWINPKRAGFDEVKDRLPLNMDDIKDAEARLKRFAPLIMELFPETKETGGIIESELTEIPEMWKAIKGFVGETNNDEANATDTKGRLFLKRDSDLAVAGSVKARGGIYEVLKHTEELAVKEGLLDKKYTELYLDEENVPNPEELIQNLDTCPSINADKKSEDNASFESEQQDAYRNLGSPEARALFSKYKMQVGSTGNLGMSIGLMSAALGYKAIVHMSCDAKEWKKKYLREHGVTVIEYEGDYGEAVAQGRAESDADPMSYFVDDENSKDLFLGYAVAALRLQKQLLDSNIKVDSDHPLVVYIPCGVGGAPGGITFGLKEIYGDDAKVFFVEPTEAPCMLVGLITGKHSEISVQDVGLSGQTHADGLAVSRPSGFVGKIMEPLLSGEMTVRDYKLYDYLRMLRDTEGIFIEPSSCAGFQGPAAIVKVMRSDGTMADAEMSEVSDVTCFDKFREATHIVWATGGRLVPEDVRQGFYETVLE